MKQQDRENWLNRFEEFFSLETPMSATRPLKPGASVILTVKNPALGGLSMTFEVGAERALIVRDSRPGDTP